MPPTIYNHYFTETIADLLQVADSPNFIQTYIFLPIILSSFMLNIGFMNITMTTIVAILSLTHRYLIHVLGMLWTIRTFMWDGNFTEAELIQVLQYLGPLQRTLASIISTFPYLITFLQGTNFVEQAEEAVSLLNRLTEIQNGYQDVFRELQIVLHNLQLHN